MIATGAVFDSAAGVMSVFGASSLAAAMATALGVSAAGARAGVRAASAEGAALILAANATGATEAALKTEDAGAGAIAGAARLPVSPAFESERADGLNALADAENPVAAAAAEPPTGALIAPMVTTWAQACDPNETWIRTKARKEARAREVGEDFLMPYYRRCAAASPWALGLGFHGQSAYLRLGPKARTSPARRELGR